MEHIANAPLTTAVRNKMAATYGVIMGIVYMVLTTVSYMSVANMMVMWMLSASSLVVSLVLIGIFGKMIRKANGGYLEFREAFGAAFVMVLVAMFFSSVYNIVYLQFIDPDMMVKMKESTLRMMENMKSSDEQLDATAINFDKRIEDAKKIEIGSALLQYFGGVLVTCLLGIIPCAIIKKPRPIFDNA